jgi:hypothetical protein
MEGRASFKQMHLSKGLHLPWRLLKERSRNSNLDKFFSEETRPDKPEKEHSSRDKYVILLTDEGRPPEKLFPPKM